MRVFNHEPWGKAWTPETARAYLQDLRDTPRSLGVVAEVEGSVIGFVLGHAEQRDQGAQFYMAEMCVLPKYQGQGVGRQLPERLEAILRAQGVGKVYLLSARGGAAETFYHACGFYTSEKMVMLGKYLEAS